jgi:GTP pyrophosphokinase
MDSYDNTPVLESLERSLSGLLSTPDLAEAMRAAVFAGNAHARLMEMRKHGAGVYLVHPVEVAILVAQAGLGVKAIAAALNHDVLENTTVTSEELEAELGEEVGNLVHALTDPIAITGENRKGRKERAVARLAGYGYEVHSIKSADIARNVPSVVEHDPKFGRVYVVENENLMRVLVNGHGGLRDLANSAVAAGRLALFGD